MNPLHRLCASARRRPFRVLLLWMSASVLVVIGVGSAHWSSVERDAVGLMPLLTILLMLKLVLAGSGLLTYRQWLREAAARLQLQRSLRHAGHAQRREHELNLALKKSTDYQQALLDNTACGIVATDVTGGIRFINRAATRSLGFPADEVVRQVSPLIFHRTEDVRAALRRIQPGDTPYRLMVEHLNAHPGKHWQLIRKDGSTFDVSITVSVMRDPAGVIDGFVTIFQDLTELNRLEELKSDFVSVVSHELRTPVTAIRGALSLHRAAVGATLPPSQQKLLAIANDNCDKLIRIVSDILDIDALSRQQVALHLSRLPLAGLLERAIEQTQPFATQYAVRYRLVAPAQPLLLTVDPDRFNQAVVNLLSNAAKFSRPDSEVVVSLREEVGQIVVRVIDYGIGIPAAFQPHIFERFSQHAAALTRKTGGTGLGLAITKMLVEAHGGRIEFHSEQGIGTTFSLWFVDRPVAPEAEQNLPADDDIFDPDRD